MTLSFPELHSHFPVVVVAPKSVLLVPQTIKTASFSTGVL